VHTDYQDRGVRLVAISPNDPKAVRLDELAYTELRDSLEEIKIRAKDKGFKFPYLYDGETQQTSLAYGVLATPHVFIFDADRKLCYNGRIDDADVKPVKSHDARNAIDALLAGRPVPVEKTRVFGCSTKWADKRLDAERSLAKWSQEPVTLDLIDEAGVKKLAANDTKKLRVINVWATWCGPCVTELPEFVTMNRMYRCRNFELITLSLDDPKKSGQALKVLQEQHVACKNYLYTGEDRDKLGDALDAKWPGPLPHTVVIAPDGKIIYRKNGAINPLEVKKVIADYLGVLRGHSNQERSQLVDGRPIGVQTTFFPAVAATLSVGGPDHLARYDAAAAEQEGHGVRPVIMARLNDAGAPTVVAGRMRGLLVSRRCSFASATPIPQSAAPPRGIGTGRPLKSRNSCRRSMPRWW
jgi:thiol-disulfide isomerase/thioredoxin